MTIVNEMDSVNSNSLPLTKNCNNPENTRKLNKVREQKKSILRTSKRRLSQIQSQRKAKFVYMWKFFSAESRIETLKKKNLEQEKSFDLERQQLISENKSLKDKIARLEADLRKPPSPSDFKFTKDQENSLIVSLVNCSLSSRSVPKVLIVINECLGLNLKVPTYQTVINLSLRASIGKLKEFESKSAKVLKKKLSGSAG